MAHAQPPAGPLARALRRRSSPSRPRCSTSCWPRATASRALPARRTSTTRSARQARRSSSRRSRAPKTRTSRPSRRCSSAEAGSGGLRPARVALSAEHVVDQALDPVEEEDPVHVVDLVEDGTRLEALALERPAQVLHLDPRRPADVRRHVGKAEAALAGDFGSLAARSRAGWPGRSGRSTSLPSGAPRRRRSRPGPARRSAGQRSRRSAHTSRPCRSGAGRPARHRRPRPGRDLLEDRVGIEEDGAGRHGTGPRAGRCRARGGRPRGPARRLPAAARPRRPPAPRRRAPPRGPSRRPALRSTRSASSRGP